MGQKSSSTSIKHFSKSGPATPLMPSEIIKVKYDLTPPRFSVTNPEEIQKGVEYLDKNGYAVFSDVLSSEEITRGLDLFWTHVESLKSPFRIRRDDPNTWDDAWPGVPEIGLFNEFGIGQSQFIWTARGNPNVKKVFSKIWNSNELCVSFDGVGCFRNWYLNKFWKTHSGWYHCDQNPIEKPDRCCIQGLVAFTDSDETTGGLVVVPGSHEKFYQLKSSVASRRSKNDYVRVTPFHLIEEKMTPYLIPCKAGDLIVWDSRSIHCNTPAHDDVTSSTIPAKSAGLLRLVTYVCMSPISMFVPDEQEYPTLEEFQRRRKELIRDRISCSHWPLELVEANNGVHGEKMPLRLNEYQQSLIIGTDVEPKDDLKELDF